QIAMLRGYSKYQQQVGTTFSQSYMDETLGRYPMVTGLLVELFEAKFDPQREAGNAASRKHAREALERELGLLTPKAVLEANPDFVARVAALLEKPRDVQVDGLVNAIKALLVNVSSLDDDRILRGFMGQIRATLRTNYFQTHDGKPAEYISYKLDSHQVPDVPKPVPYREIWVYAPRGRRAPALRAGRARWHPLVGSPRGFPNRGAWTCEGADGEENRDRAGRFQGRFLREAAAGRTRRAAGRGHRLLQDVHQWPARHHRQHRHRGEQGAASRRRGAPRRRRFVPRGRRRQGHGEVFRHRKRLVDRTRILAGRCFRLGWLGGFRSQGHGHHLARRLG